jgi:hypothetical protein
MPLLFSLSFFVATAKPAAPSYSFFAGTAILGCALRFCSGHL